MRSVVVIWMGFFEAGRGVFLLTDHTALWILCTLKLQCSCKNTYSANWWGTRIWKFFPLKRKISSEIGRLLTTCHWINLLDYQGPHGWVNRAWSMGFFWYNSMFFCTLPSQMQVVFYCSVLLIDKIIMAIFIFFNSTEQLILWYLGLEK